MPLAVQYGMPLDEFWHGDMRLLEVYQKAYTRNISYTSWLNGQANYVGFSVVMQNAFAKKGAKKAEYPKWVDPIEKQVKTQKNNNLENKYRNLQQNQNNFIKELLNRK